jgi:hypothetical protein
MLESYFSLFLYNITTFNKLRYLLSVASLRALTKYSNEEEEPSSSELSVIDVYIRHRLMQASVWNVRPSA